MDDNVWEYPFGELDDDDDMFFQRPEIKYMLDSPINKAKRAWIFSPN